MENRVLLRGRSSGGVVSEKEGAFLLGWISRLLCVFMIDDLGIEA